MFSYASKIYKSSITLFNTGSSGNPDSRSPIFHYNCLNPESVQELPLPAPQLLISSHSNWERSVSSKQCLIGIQSRMGVNLIGLRSLPDPPGFWSPGTSFGIF